MERISAQLEGKQRLAMSVLSWIVHAKRRLTRTELRYALAIKAGKAGFDVSDLPEVSDMVSVCAGLVTIDQRSNVVRLVHYTAQEYLYQTRRKWFPGADSMITTACITCLSFDGFATEASWSVGQFPFYSYAASCWGYHARQAPELTREVVGFLRCASKIEASVPYLRFVVLCSHPWHGPLTIY